MTLSAHDRNGTGHATTTQVSGLLKLAESDLAAAIRKVLDAEALADLAQMAADAPGDLEQFFLSLRSCGAKVREVDRLRSTVRAEAKRRKREAVEKLRERIRADEPPPKQDGPRPFANYYEEEVESDNGDIKVARIGLPAKCIADDLFARTGGWPKRVDNLLFAEGDCHRPRFLLKPPQTFAYIASRLPGFAANPVRWADGADKISQPVFHNYLAQTAEGFDALEAYPHYPARPSTYYMHPEVCRGDGSAFRDLLDFFKPASLVDRDLILAYFLTLVWGGPPGKRPAFLVTTDHTDGETGRGFGKTTLIEAGGRLFGGCVIARTNQDADALATRLLSPAAMTLRVALLDNVKTLRLSDADLESFITTDTISGRRLYTGEGRRPNNITWALTLNGASLSKDMAQRCVIIKLDKPDYRATWQQVLDAYIEERRWEIIGDLIGILQAPGHPLAGYSRWGLWEEAVLTRVGDPSECQQVILERQQDVDADDEEADLVREAFIHELEYRGHTPAAEAKVLIPSSVAADIVNEATGESRPKNKASGYLKTLKIKELRKSDRGVGKGWLWTGVKAKAEATTAPMNRRPAF
jgi:hypothetical protein